MKLMRIIFVMVLGAAGVSARASDQAGKVVLAENATARSVIVVAADAPPPDKHAADELARFLGEVTTGTFRIVNEIDPAGQNIAVGVGAAKLLDPAFNLDGIGQDGIVMRTTGDDLILAGQGTRGTLYSVYTFLEDAAGCRWWSPAASTIPKRTRLEIGPLDVRYAPQILFREPYWCLFQDDGAWCVRNKNYGRISATSAPELGGRYTDILSVHNFYQLIPPDEYFDKHPEWFSEVKGERVRSNGQLCLTNPQLRDEVYSKIKQIPITHPGISAIWIGQNDWDGYCQCATCTAVIEREGTPGGPLIEFVNDLAERIEQVDPNTSISTFAYEWSQKPPAHLKPRKNVNIWLATTGCSYAHPYTDPVNKVFQERLESWAKICDRIFIWDYVTNFAGYLSPYPNLRTLAPNMRDFAKHNVAGVWSQGAYSAPGAEFSELRAWVLLKLMWNPSLDGDALIDEFLDGYYGPAGRDIRAYIEVFHNAMEASGKTIYMTDQPLLGRHLTVESILKGYELMRAAGNAVRNDPVLHRRVQVAQLPVLYVVLLNWDALKEEARKAGLEWPFSNDMKPLYERFVKACEENGITQKSESNARDLWPWIEMRATAGPEGPPPADCRDIPRSRWVQLQDRSFNLKPPYAELGVSDPLASDGSAGKMNADHDVPAIQKQLYRVPLVLQAAANGTKIRCKFSARCVLSDTAQPEGAAFKVDFENNSGTFGAREIAIRDLDRNGQYQTIDLGTHTGLDGWASLRIAPANNPDVKEIWIDRIWLIEE